MKALLSISTALVFSVSSTVFAQGYPVKMLQASAVICFDFSDWRDMVAASIDQDLAAASRLVSSGACRVVPDSTRVAYIDRAAGNFGSIIQMPSGKTAFTSDAFLK
ncbi:hypothetical protein IM720_08860 [Pseudomonas fluorescens]|uniref:Uncharacterized protein n=1 Tax=Pseudomonas fluorescens TaxID=294 RepID=A0A7M2JAX5_PSEFL|nr:hypothetical protein [Pseudomonas fluorescens]QOU06817.1 hypothetical protein IM720_08860 [Pseudomonas fluorescens]